MKIAARDNHSSTYSLSDSYQNNSSACFIESPFPTLNEDAHDEVADTASTYHQDEILSVSRPFEKSSDFFIDDYTDVKNVVHIQTNKISHHSESLVSDTISEGKLTSFYYY